MLLSDTVGFIRDLPHHLVASFKATLEEARQARLLLHIVDASSPQAERHIQSVLGVLKELDCNKRPNLLVLNKIDAVTDRANLDILMAQHPRAVAISGKTGEGIETLVDTVIEMLSSDFAPTEIILDAGNGKTLAFLNAHAEIFRQEYRGNDVVVRCYLPKHLLHQVQIPGVQVQFLDFTTKREPSDLIES